VQNYEAAIKSQVNLPLMRSALILAVYYKQVDDSRPRGRIALPTGELKQEFSEKFIASLEDKPLVTTLTPPMKFRGNRGCQTNPLSRIFFFFAREPAFF